MNAPLFTPDQLRRAFTPTQDAAAMPIESCPAAERLDAAARRQLGAQDCEPIVLHVAQCAACTAAWKLATGMAAPRSTRSTLQWVGLAAAVAVLVVGGYSLKQLGERAPDVQRGPVGGSAIVSEIERDAVLPRDRCLLRWTRLEGARYEVTVSDDQLRLLLDMKDLDQAELLVPAESLPAASGSRLLWQVTARWPNGERRVSSTFSFRLR